MRVLFRNRQEVNSAPTRLTVKRSLPQISFSSTSIVFPLICMRAKVSTKSPLAVGTKQHVSKKSCLLKNTCFCFSFFGGPAGDVGLDAVLSPGRSKSRGGVGRGPEPRPGRWRGPSLHGGETPWVSRYSPSRETFSS